MTISQVQFATAVEFAGTTATATFPVAATAGNLLVCGTGGDGHSGSGPPAGFTLIESAVNASGAQLSYKVAAGGETTFSVGATTFKYKGLVVVELASSDGWGVFLVSSQATAAGFGVTCPTVTPTVYPALDLGVHGQDGFDSAAPYGSSAFDPGSTFTSTTSDGNVSTLGWRVVAAGNAGGQHATTGTSRTQAGLTGTYGVLIGVGGFHWGGIRMG